MQPNTPNQPFTQQHHEAYNKLRNVVQNHVAKGVPGMKNVLAAVDKSHTSLLGSMADMGMKVFNAVPDAAANTPNPFQQYPGRFSQNPFDNAEERTRVLAKNTLGNPYFWADAGLTALPMMAAPSAAQGVQASIPRAIYDVMARWGQRQ